MVPPGGSRVPLTGLIRNQSMGSYIGVEATVELVTLDEAVIQSVASKNFSIQPGRERIRTIRRLVPESLPSGLYRFRLKIGLHQGPCIAVRSYDDRLDYFGSTVNLAARTHEQSLGDDIVTTDAILQDPEVQALLTNVPREEFSVDLRGLGEHRLWRLRP